MPHDHAHASPGRIAPSDAAKITARITWFSVGAAILLSAVKLAAVIASGSVALLASLGDSALDLVAALITFFAVRYAATPADKEHRHGHGKAEAFAALMQAGIVAISATLIAREAANRFLSPDPVEQTAWALSAMAVSIVVTILLVNAQTRAVNQTGSVAVVGDRMHYASDLAANFSVIVALVLAGYLGVRWADPVVGLGVALWLLWSAWNVAKGALDQMMDRELADEDRDRIRALAAADPAILGVHQLRTRAAGPFVHIQFHADLPPGITLDEAHRVMVAAERRILDAYPGADVLIHPDPHGEAEPHGNPHMRADPG